MSLSTAFRLFSASITPACSVRTCCCKVSFWLRRSCILFCPVAWSFHKKRWLATRSEMISAPQSVFLALHAHITWRTACRRVSVISTSPWTSCIVLADSTDFSISFFRSKMRLKGPKVRDGQTDDHQTVIQNLAPHLDLSFVFAYYFRNIMHQCLDMFVFLFFKGCTNLWTIALETQAASITLIPLLTFMTRISSHQTVLPCL